MQLTIDDLIELNYLCEWMDALPYKSFYPNQLPIRYFPDHRTKIDIVFKWVSNEYRIKRRKAKLFWWCRGWGWRLSKDWRNKIVELEKQIPIRSTWSTYSLLCKGFRST